MKKTRANFDQPLRTIVFERPGPGLPPEAWVAVRSEVCRWVGSGCACIRRGGDLVDLVSLAEAAPEDLAGAELVIYHKHLDERFPDDARLLWQPE